MRKFFNDFLRGLEVIAFFSFICISVGIVLPYLFSQKSDFTLFMAFAYALLAIPAVTYAFYIDMKKTFGGKHSA